MILLMIVITLTALICASAALHERDQANARAKNYEVAWDANLANHQVTVNVRVVNGRKAMLRVKAAALIVRFAVFIGNFGAAQITS